MAEATRVELTGSGVRTLHSLALNIAYSTFCLEYGTRYLCGEGKGVVKERFTSVI